LKDKLVLNSLLYSFKQGSITFIALLFSLGLFEIFQNTFLGHSSTIIDNIDVAMAGLGFILMFLAKFFERLSGKR
jgi:hypothetical protein